MRMSRNPNGDIEIYTDIGQFIGILPPDYPGVEKMAMDGGPGSGNYGHAGRPGKVGGSAKGSGGSAFRAGSKESGYSSFAKHEAFKGILSNAKASSSYYEFLHAMSTEQKNAIRNQRAACGTSESLQTYATRIYNMLHNREKVSEIRQKNKPIDGRDLTGTWKSKFGSSSGSSTKAIDTDIEDILHQQGFDGVPKIVSKAEFDRITKEHPEMPILMRSYTGKNEAELKSFDDDLEHGFFYVDCSNGGAGFGQGMYTAATYRHEPERFNLEEDYRGHGARYVKMKNGEIYKVEGRYFETNNMVLRYPDPGDQYLFTKEDENGNIINKLMKAEDLGEYGVVWIDQETAEMYDQPVWMGEFDTFQDVETITEAGARKEMLAGARTEMEHYSNIGRKRIENDYIPDPPEGKERARGYDNNGEAYFYYYDDKNMVQFEDDFPKDGELVAVKNPRSRDGSDASIYSVQNGRLVSLDRRWVLNKDELEPYETWSYLDGRCKEENLSPVSSIRLMTLDPSAKIIKYEELEDRVSEAKQKRYAEELRENTDKYLSDSGINDEAVREIFFHQVKSTGGSNQKAEEMIANATEEQRKILDMIENNMDVEKIRKLKQDASGKAHDSFPDDIGACAALLGYDAINADGHGQSRSYTVILNRTKVILSEDKVDLGK